MSATIMHREIITYNSDEGDYLFLVIGRGEEPSDYKSLERGVVVYDPWSGACYPVVKIDQFLNILKVGFFSILNQELLT